MAAAPRSKRKRKARAVQAPVGAVAATATETGHGGDPIVRAPSAEPPTVDTRRERRLGIPAAACALASILLTIGAVPVAATGPRIDALAGSDKQLLLQVGVSGVSQLAAMWMRVASVLVLIVVALFLYRATAGRNPAHGRWVPLLGIAAFLIVAASTAVGFFETRDAAHTYLASGPRTVPRATFVLAAQRAQGPLRAADVGRLVGAIMFGIWVSMSAYEGMRVGLFTRFLGVFGVAAGFTTVVGIPVSTALFLGWLGSFGLLAAGWWPDGRPLAWDAGRAVSWDEADAMSGSTTRSHAT